MGEALGFRFPESDIRRQDPLHLINLIALRAKLISLIGISVQLLLSSESEEGESPIRRIS
jgi:hypothetical protein